MSETTRAIVCRDTHANGGWKMEELKVREPGEGELLIEMVASGICHTDALIGDLPDGASPMAFYPRVLGHEGSGYVKKIGKGVTVAKEGDPVLLSYAFCNKCALCKEGKTGYCVQFAYDNFGGPFNVFKKDDSDISAQFFGQSSFAALSVVRECSVVNAKDLVKDKKELQLFSPLGCGIQTGSGTVINTAKAGPKDIVVIMGLGGVGLSAIMGAKVAECGTIIGVDRVKSRLDLSRELGATHVINTSELPEGKQLADVVKEHSDGIGATVVIDTTGVAALIKEGWTFTRNCGQFIQVGTPPFDFNLEIPVFSDFLTGKQWKGAIEGSAYPPDYVPKMVKWYKDGKFPIDKLMKLMPADEFEQGLKEMHDGVTIKPIITWS